MTPDEVCRAASLTEIHTYPVKSCRGTPVSSATVEPWGLRDDRRWMVVDDSGMVLTARTCAPLLLVSVTLTENGLVAAFPDLETMHVLRPVAGPSVPVQVFSDHLSVWAASAEASAWFSQVAGRSVTLVYQHDPTTRPTNPQRSRPGDVVSLADGFPLLLASEESLVVLNGWIANGAHAADGPLPMTRFRPNLVVSGAPAWAEDAWRRLRIGDTTFRSVKACDRCVMTMIDPDTAAKTKEPLFSLARHRRWDNKTWFAVNLIPDQPCGTVRLGDAVEVLERTEETSPQR